METTPRPDLKPYKKVYKIIVIGDSNVGKTSLTYRFCEGDFLETAEATIGVDFRSRNLEIDGEEITVSSNLVSLRPGRFPFLVWYYYPLYCKGVK